MKRWLLAGGALAALALAAGPASADEHYFTRLFDWYTPEKHQKEFEIYHTQRDGGDLETQYEFEYGVTDRYSLSPYLLLGREHGGEYDFRGLKLEQRYRLGKFAHNRFLPALLLELDKEESEPYRLEGRLITSYVVNDRLIWSTNLIFEGATEDHSKVDSGYATGANYALNERWQAGAELFGNWTEDEHFLGPTIGYRVNESTKILLNAGFKYVGDAGGSVRLFFEKEWK